MCVDFIVWLEQEKRNPSEFKKGWLKGTKGALIRKKLNRKYNELRGKEKNPI